MKVVEADGFEFRFADALDAFVFDETDNTQPTFHGAPMKGVDIVAEFDEAYVYVEMKDYDDQSIFDVLGAATDGDKEARQKHFKWLKNYLKYKFRDSYLYRHAEQKVEKPIHYVCLITFDNALNSRMQKSLKQELPVGKASRRWIQPLATSCHVVNLDKWNENFPKWPVTRLAAAIAGGA
ncbi:MAG: hypothetical protein IH613_00825 [Desulfuromonadales bacterium]|nr:hypothetical protein [Desulfuromonadales bacterium]